MLLALPGDGTDDSASVHQKKVFGAKSVELLKRFFSAEGLNVADQQEVEAAYRACVARDHTTSSRHSIDGTTRNYFTDYHKDMEEEYLDHLLLACMHCGTVEHIRKLRTHDFEHEHEAIFDDVLKIIESGDDAEMLLFGLCPLKNQSGNCDDEASLDNRSTKAIAAMFPKSKFLNISEFCVRTEPRKKGQPECCVSVFSARDFRVRVKLLQMKMILLHRTGGSPKGVGAMSKEPHHAMQCLVLPPSTYVVSEIVSAHTTYLSGTFGGGGGGFTKSRLSGVRQMKYRAYWAAWSNAALALTMEKVSLLEPEQRAALSALPKNIPQNTKPRRIEDVLGGVHASVRPTEEEVHARVTELLEAVQCVLKHADDIGEMTFEEAEAEYARIQGLKGALSPPSPLA